MANRIRNNSLVKGKINFHDKKKGKRSANVTLTYLNFQDLTPYLSLTHTHTHIHTIRHAHVHALTQTDRVEIFVMLEVGRQSLCAFQIRKKLIL